MRKVLFSLMSTFTVLLLSVAVTFAQGACSEFIGHALQAVDASCQGLGRNQACYGYNRVEASFQSEVADDFFSQTADVTDVAEIETIRTAPFNQTADEWGVAVMVLQANMPDTLPGQNVTFILMGDTELENAVSVENAHTPAAGIDVTVTFPQGAAVRSGPGDNFNTIAGVVVGTVFTTDGMSADGAWLRIVWNDRPAWIRRTTVLPLPEIESLPVFNEDLRTPMQSFYLRTGIGQPECEEVPDNSLLIQGPDDVQIDLTINGANISLGSSGILRVLNPGSPEPELEITVLDGEFVVHADENNPQDIVIRAGQRSTLCLQDGNNMGVNGQADDLLVSCAASPPETVDTTQFIADWCSLESLPSNLLNYALQTCSMQTHTVQSGENLFRISQFYCVSLDDLIALNGIANAGQVAVGTVLTLPRNACEGSGSTRPPADVITTPDPSIPATCTVNLISPLNDVDSGNHIFSWSAVSLPDVTYHLVFYNFEGQRVETFSTSETSYTLNLGRQTSTGGEFSWEVEVSQNGIFQCASGRSGTLIRLGTLNPNPNPTAVVSSPGVVVSLGISCSYGGSLAVITTITLNWSGLPAGESINFVVTSGGSPVANQTLTSTSGSDSVSGIGTFNGSATATTGETASGTC